MRALALLLLGLLAVARADVVIRSEEPNDVPGLQRETFYVVDDSPEARSADGGSPVKGIMTHVSASGPRAFAALFGGSAESSHWSSWMDQQVGALSSVHQALMPAITEVPQRHRGCSRHKKAMAAAAGAREASPRSYSSPDEALLQRMAAARLSPQLLSLLMADAERDTPEYIVALGSQGRPRPQLPFSDNDFADFEAGTRNAAERQAAEGAAAHAEVARSVLAVEVCDETGCTIQFQGGSEPRAAQAVPESLPSSRFFDSHAGGSWAADPRMSFEQMAQQRRGAATTAAVPAPREGDQLAWGSQMPADDMTSPLNPGLILFMFLCTACVFVWTRLAILCCTLRRCGGRRHRRRCRKGAAEAPLLESLAPESAASDSLAIYTNALYAPPKGLHPQVFGARPYGVQVAAEHTTAPPQGNAYVTIQYVPLQSEGASKA